MELLIVIASTTRLPQAPWYRLTAKYLYIHSYIYHYPNPITDAVESNR